jgi:hypothetical protein
MRARTAACWMGPRGSWALRSVQKAQAWLQRR